MYHIRNRSSLTWICAVLGVLSLAFVPACNTTEGVGEDVEALGESIDEAAEDSQD